MGSAKRTCKGCGWTSWRSTNKFLEKVNTAGDSVCDQGDKSGLNVGAQLSWMHHDAVLWARKSLPPRTENDSAAQFERNWKILQLHFLRDSHLLLPKQLATNTKVSTMSRTLYPSRGCCYIAVLHPTYLLSAPSQLLHCAAVALAPNGLMPVQLSETGRAACRQMPSFSSLLRSCC